MEISNMKINPVSVMFFIASIIALPMALALGALIDKDIVDDDGNKLCK